MKKALLTLICLAAMMTASMSIKAQEVTIMLKPGWTWISYPSADTVDFATALGTFTPRAGDVIACEYDYSEYFGGEWLGGIQHFYPGYGYMYYSSRNMPVFLTFNAQQPSPQVVVTTSEPTDITTNSATSGGTITTDAYVFAKGICWATHPGPTQTDDYYSENGSGDESFTAEMTGLSQNTTYYVRAYVVTQSGIAYGNEVSFTTIPIWTIEAMPNPTNGGTITGAGEYEQDAICNLIAIANEGYIFTNWTENGEVVSTDATYAFTVDASRSLVANFDLDHIYVDLGLPSGLLWATCNLGANIPEEYGDYFAWGETQPKDNFSWTNYQYCMGSFNTLTKYCNNPDIGYNGFTDDLTTLEPNDDAATANWGDDWRMPTQAEWQELYQNTTVTWTTQNGVRGRLFTALNGNSLFLPAAGYCNESSPEGAGIIGDYWTSSLDTDYPSGALSFFFNSSNYYIGFCNRLYGRNVRAVRSWSQNTSYIIDATANPAEGGEVTGIGTYQQGDECTLIATANEGYTFTNWTENGEVVSTDATYTFTVSGDRNLVAAFCETSTYPLLYWFNENDHTATVTGHWDGTNATGELVIPETVMHNGETYMVTAIGDWAFSGCSGLTGNLIIPNTVTSIGFQAFGFCSGFSGNLIIPNSVSMIVERAFANCSGFTGELVISNSINRIEQLTFIGCSGFTGNLVIPSSVTSITWGAFAECIGLTSITPLAEMPPTLTDDPFRELSRDIPIYLPCGSLEAYQNAEGWNEFTNYIEMCDTVPTGAINGKFTINEDGDQVYFSQGNLQYQASTNTWRFAENQWDFVGGINYNELECGTVYENGVKCNNNEMSSTYFGWIDLFGWGTSGYNHGANYFLPWSTSQNNSDYFAYGSANYNLSDQTGQADWGYNVICNGENIENRWRTLNRSEWDYVMNTRVTNSGLRFVKAQVNDIKGLILLPDDWDTTIYSFNNSNNNTASFNDNVISAFQWTTLENSGVVFLPAAGQRIGSNYAGSVNGGGCCYWSTTNYDSGHAYYLCVFDSYFYITVHYRYYGMSVRLICPVE